MSEEEAGEKIAPLPACDGSNGIKGVDCKKVKPLPPCRGNVGEKLGKGEEATCRVLPKCVDNPGMPADECFNKESLAQRNRKGIEEPVNSGEMRSEEGQAEPKLPACSGKKEEVKGVDCLVPKADKKGKKSLAQVRGEDDGPEAK